MPSALSSFGSSSLVLPIIGLGMAAAFVSRRRMTQLYLLATRTVASAASAAPTLNGILYRYKHADWPAPLQAFESPMGHQHKRFCVYVGGLTDGLLACSYVEALGPALDQRGWALVQPVLTSSYAGFGCSSLAKDAAEIAELLAHLTRREGPDVSFAIIGHSTGCQDAVTLLKTAPPELRCKIRAAVLQAPVSDRESKTLEPDGDDREKLLAEAERMVAAGRGEDLLSEKYYGFVPMSASRYASLVGRGGPDDVFSSDFSNDELRALLNHMGTSGQRKTAPQHPGLRTLFCFSGGDEYVPPSVDVAELSARFVAAAGGAENGASAVILEGASHNLATPPAACGQFVEWACRTLDDAVREG